jgi:hypothetical protein
LGDLHAPEQKGLGALQRVARRRKVDVVEPNSHSRQDQKGQPETEEQSSFETGHGITSCTGPARSVCVYSSIVIIFVLQ